MDTSHRPSDPEHTSTSNPAPLGDTTNRPRRVTSNLNLGNVKKSSGKLVDTLRRSFSIKTKKPEPSPALPIEADEAANGLSVSSFKALLKSTNFRRSWFHDDFRAFQDLHDKWHQQERKHRRDGTPACPLFPFGYHKGIWYNLLPDANLLYADFSPNDPNRDANTMNWLNHTPPTEFICTYPASANRASMFHLEYETWYYTDNGAPCGVDSEVHGFNCLTLGELQWTRGSPDTSRRQLRESKWTYSPIIILVEILEDGTPGPIWVRRDEDRGFGVDVGDFKTVTGLGGGWPQPDWHLAKIGNSIDDMSMREWVMCENVRKYCEGDHRFPLYQSREDGRLKYVIDEDEEMESDSDGEQDPSRLEAHREANGTAGQNGRWTWDMF